MQRDSSVGRAITNNRTPISHTGLIPIFRTSRGQCSKFAGEARQSCDRSWTTHSRNLRLLRRVTFLWCTHDAEHRTSVRLISVMVSADFRPALRGASRRQRTHYCGDQRAAQLSVIEMGTFVHTPALIPRYGHNRRRGSNNSASFAFEPGQARN